MSYAVWTMVQIRRIKRGDDLDESDQTAEVVENMDGKVLPSIDMIPVATSQPPNTVPPLPPSGLPAGWTMEQWSHYGQQYIESMGPNQQ
jgi:hypothetical protein